MFAASKAQDRSYVKWIFLTRNIVPRNESNMENTRIREMTTKLHYRSGRNFSADTINTFDVGEYHVGHELSSKSPYTSVFFIRTIIRAALKARKRSKSDLAVDGARLTSGNRWLEWHLKLLKGSPYRSQPFTPSPEGRLSQWTRV